MAGFDREEPVWYYQLGGKALGPVPWSEIEELLEDAFEAKDLLVARGGDDTWVSAQSVIDEFEEDEPAEADADEEPVEKVEEEPREPLTPVHGLKAWIRQAWGIVAGDMGQFVGGSILTVVLSAVSLMICFPALHAGLYVLALKRFRGEKFKSGDFIKGFQFFGRAMGLYVVIFLIGLPFLVASIVAYALFIAAVQDSEVGTALAFSAPLIAMVVNLAMALPVAVAFFAMPLMIDRDMGAMEALKASWAVTSRDFISYLGMAIVLSLVAGAGGLLCTLGVVFTLPILPAAQVCAYRYHFRDAA